MIQKIITSKIYTHEKQLFQNLNIWRFQQKKIVFTNGCFDILHAGHVDYLAKASALGDILIIGLNSDRSVSENKGPKRPINNEVARAQILAGLFFVDAVVLFDTTTPYELINFIQPDVLIKGADYKQEEIAGYDIVKRKGGEVFTLTLLPGYSTTAIEKKIVENYGR